MEAPAAELSSEAVLSFLRARGGRVPHAELVQHFKGLLGGEAEARARARAHFKELVNAVATVRTEPADGAKSVQLKRSFRESLPPLPGAPAAPEPPGEAARLDVRDGARGAGDPDSASWAEEEEEEEDGGGGASAAAAVTLEPLEHAWMLSAADGRWDGLQELLACEPALLTKRDFITGFTCLHWAAKHGRHELLALLVTFAAQHGLPVNINARASGGYTALHLAAMHGHAEVVKLLVGAYDADVDVRDYSGRKASQYLSRSTAEEIKSLVGALEEAEEESAVSRGSGRWRLSKVLPAHLIAHRLAHGPEDGGDHHHHHHHATEGWAGGKAKDPGRKAPGSSSGRIKPRLNKIRFRTQIIHTTPSFRDSEQPLEEGEEEEEERGLKGHAASFKLRPKSNVFG